ncbi:hypothetical protein EJ08DRAFT_692638 [Tothia fuscella]|uniref:Uncharacterized protein n=1 Tax=Tothia fuscella TaxID=1048955 RepID=A0A9P4P1V1_9PEZI|nr:hypothetical protein EJ08DRAFT_692638 [Tothia fuscella]
MISSEKLLERAAEDGTFESDDWPRVLEDILERLEQIYASEFPPPTLPPDPPPRPRLGSPISILDDHNSSQDSTTSNKENTPAAKSSTPRPPVPSFTQSSSTTQTTQSTAASESQATQTGPSTATSFPPDIITLHQSIRNNLNTNFPTFPPYSIQRLAELILYPKKHYRYLPPYLNALDRTVSVSSNITIFPLPQATLPNTGLLNGSSFPNHTSPAVAALGSDESLGGALLTPIPWLSPVRDAQAQRVASANNDRELQRESTEIVDGPNGAGRIETVSVVNGVMTTVYSPAPIPPQSAPSSSSPPTQQPAGHAVTDQTLRAEGAVTQGELLRQEQEAGVVPVSPRRLRMSDEEMRIMDADEQDEEDEKPHARGPEEIGMEDTGPQEPHLSGAPLDMEHAVGRHRRATSVERDLAAQEMSPVAESVEKEEEMKDADVKSDVGASASLVAKAKATEVEEKKNSEDKSANGDVEITDADGVAVEDSETDKKNV